MVTRHRQQGMTAIGWLVLLVIIGTLALVALRIVPAYTEFYTILQTVESVHGQATAESTPTQLRADIGRRFNVNDVESLNPRDIPISRNDGVLTIHIQYEYRTKMMGNIDAVVVFDRVVGG